MPAFVAPSLPTGLVMSSLWQPVMTFAQVLPVLGVLWFAYTRWLPDARGLATICLLGGGLASLLEPVVDNQVQVLFAERHMWVMFTTFGRSMPWFILPCYVWFIGGQTIYVLHRARAGMGPRDVARLWLVFLLLNIAMEGPALAAGIYTYFGRQALSVAGLPLWIQCCNASIPLVAGAVLLRLWPLIPRPARVLAVMVPPSAYAITSAVAGWPMWTVLHTTDDLTAVTLCGVASVALAIGLAWIASLALVRTEAPSSPTSTSALSAVFA
jgi:hypothetical protein